MGLEVQEDDKLCPILNKPCVKDNCAWFEPLMKCCWAIRNDVKQARDSEIRKALAEQKIEWERKMRELQIKQSEQLSEYFKRNRGGS